MRSFGRILVSAMLVAGGVVAAAPPAGAAFHLMKITEVFAGAAGAVDVQFIELQMYQGGQNVVANHSVFVYGANGLPLDTYTFPSNVSNGTNQARIVVATANVQTYFGIAPDLVMDSAAIPAAGGAICFDATKVDCVAWGNYTAMPPPGSPGQGDVGTPYRQNDGGIATGTSMLRDISAGNPTTLEPTDDTQSSAADFDPSMTPTPTNNAGASGNPGGTLAFAAATASVNEDDGARTVQVARTGGTGNAVSVDYATDDGAGTATVGDDYETTSGTLQFATGQTSATFDVPIIDDAEINEPIETIVIRLTNATNRAVLGTQDSTAVEILDDDGVAFVSLDAQAYTIGEGAPATITILRGGNRSETSTVVFTSSNGTALAGSDYTDATTTLTFDPDIASVQVDVATLADQIDEPNETINLTLSDPSSNTMLNDPSSATVQIQDDDLTPVSRVTRPRHNTSYARSKLTRLTGTASDADNALDRVQVALRRTMTNGRCKWWMGHGWSATRSCSSKVWRAATGTSTWSYRPSSLLPKSVGTTTRYYTAFSRAFDGAGNTEGTFSTGRNANRFEIR